VSNRADALPVLFSEPSGVEKRCARQGVDSWRSATALFVRDTSWSCLITPGALEFCFALVTRDRRTLSRYRPHCDLCQCRDALYIRRAMMLKLLLTLCGGVQRTAMSGLTIFVTLQILAERHSALQVPRCQPKTTMAR
jgi:hypothetical protein